MNENLGYSLTTAGLVIALMTGMQIVGQVIGGFGGDRFSKRWMCVTCMAGHSHGILALAYAGSLVLVAAFAVLHGMAWGVRGPLMRRCARTTSGGRRTRW